MKKFLIIITVLFITSCSSEIENSNHTALVSQPFGNCKKILETVKLEALNGDMRQQTELGMMYRDGKGVQKDIHESIKWFELAAKNGSVNAIMSLGVIYGGGNLGVPKNSEKAIYYYKQIAESDRLPILSVQTSQPIAQVFLAKSYEDIGDKKNALLWYKKALDNENTIGVFRETAQTGLKRLSSN